MKKRNYPLDYVEYSPNFKEIIAKSARLAGAKTAYKFKKDDVVKSVTYSEFQKLTQSLGTGLYTLGHKTSHVAIVSENRFEWITTLFAVLAGEGVVIPTDKELPIDEIINILTHSDSEAVFTSATYVPQFKERLDKLPNVKHFICFDLDPSEADDRFVSYEGLIAAGRAALDGGNLEYVDADLSTQELKMLVYTSGTTGTSKGVMLSQNNLTSCLYHGTQISTVGEVNLSVLPYHHSYPLMCDIVACFNKQATLCINENLRTVAANMKEYKPDFICLVPLYVESFYKKIWANAEESGRADKLRKGIKMSNALRKIGVDKRRTLFKSIHDSFGGNLAALGCGGAPLRAEMVDFFDAIGIKILNGYGITECSPLISVNRLFFNDFRTTGVLIASLELKIDQPNENGEGEICVRGENVMMGYYKNPEATALAIDDEGWFHTGDLGKINEHKQVYVTGRKKNLIVLSNGKNIYPEEMEGYVYNIPYVAECVILADVNDNGQEVGLIAEVFLNEDFVKDMDKDARKAAMKQEIDKLNKTLPSFKHIHKVRIRQDEFEKTTTRKIKRSDIGVSVIN
ncbi:MAG: AMP-binding protein [Oscillospiraceae bacterium]|nr:AMP-binding protein [Oscillospiraceae bacterium]